jgi:hypothetical protein
MAVLGKTSLKYVYIEISFYNHYSTMDTRPLISEFMRKMKLLSFTHAHGLMKRRNRVEYR